VFNLHWVAISLAPSPQGSGDMQMLGRDQTKLRSQIKFENVKLHSIPAKCDMATSTTNCGLKELVEGTAFKLSYESLKVQQKEAIMAWKRCFVVLPTGYGKSLCYMCLSPAFDRLLKRETSIVLIISPLIALMEDQIRLCVSRGMKSIKVGKFTDEIKKIIDGEYQMVYISPESLLAWRKCYFLMYTNKI